jgi:RNA polymerase sigma-70 factor, ECF subfamily
MSARPSSPQAAPESHARLLRAFCDAATSGDISAFAGLLREDAIAITDGGGRKSAALNPIRGAQKIIRFLIGIAGKNATHDIQIVPMIINGSAGALLYMDGEIDHMLSVAIDGAQEKIAAIYLARNPDKLRRAPPAN